MHNGQNDCREECYQTNHGTDQHECRQITVEARAIVKSKSSIEVWGERECDQYFNTDFGNSI